jgi:hypothetical protein
MSASKIGLHNFVASVRAAVPEDLHPAGLATIHVWLGHMTHAADRDDPLTVARLSKLVTEKVKQEIMWRDE